MPRRLTAVLALTSLSAMLLLLSACDSTGKISNPISNPLESIAGDWTVDQIGGQDVAGMLPAGARLPNLTIGRDGSVNGFGGVNRFTSSLNLDKLTEGAFDLSPAAATRMAGPPEAMAVESSLFEAIGNTTGFDLDGDRMHLKRDDSTLVQLRRSAGG